MARGTGTADRTHRSQSTCESLPRAHCTRTNIVLDDALIQEARELTGLQAKRAIVEEALRTLVRVQKQRRGLVLFGKLPWEGDLPAIRRGRSLTVGD